MHDIVMDLARAFQRHEKQFYLVGGTVRDALLGRESHDIDCTTDALPEQIKTITAETTPLHIVPIGEKFGTIQLVYADDVIIEVTTYRGERYEPGSRKPVVSFGTSLHEDLRRRDFTINAIAQDPLTGKYVDPFDGLDDLQRGIIRAVDDPIQRFRDDPLRLMRAVRFAAQFKFIIGHDTKRAMVWQRDDIHQISAERIRDEMCKMLATDDASWYLCLLRTTCGLDKIILPEVAAMIGVEQPPHHTLDVYNHTLKVIDMVPSRLTLRWAALLHDIAKPATKTVDEQGHAHFYRHEDVGAEMTRAILNRLRFSNDFISHVCKVVSMHMRVNQYSEKWSNASVRRLYADAGDALEDLLDLAVADGASDRHESLEVVTARINHLRERIAQVSTEVAQRPMVCPLNGRELMALFGRGHGPWLTPMKQHLQDLVIDGVLAADDKQAAMEAAKVFDTQCASH